MDRSASKPRHSKKSAFERGNMVFATRTLHKSVAQVARMFKTDPKTVRRWRTRYETTSTVEDARRSGRPPLLGLKALKRALELLGSANYDSSTEVSKVLAEENLTPHILDRTTVVRAAKKEAQRLGLTKLKFYRGEPSKLLSDKNKKERVAFCKRHIHTNWNNVFFTDRKRFRFKYPGTSVHPGYWSHAGKKLEVKSINHPYPYNIYAGVSRYGVTPGRAVAGTYGLASSFHNKKGQVSKSITAEEYADVMKASLLPQGSRLLSTRDNLGSGNWFFQQDNDTAHKKGKEVLDQYNQENRKGIQMILDWPPNSPDLSPIENIWGIVDQKVAAKGCKTFADFCKEVDMELEGIPNKTREDLWSSMRRRMQHCIDLKGGRVPY
jgi:hypothetical protein